MPRKSDEEVWLEYMKAMGHNPNAIALELRPVVIGMVTSCRRDEPRINSGLHLCDYINICDDDDTFESFYGDYFAQEDTGLSLEEEREKRMERCLDLVQELQKQFDRLSPEQRLEIVSEVKKGYCEDCGEVPDRCYCGEAEEANDA
jgi:hypothetical protein